MMEVLEGLRRYVDLHGGAVVLVAMGLVLVAVAVVVLVRGRTRPGTRQRPAGRSSPARRARRRARTMRSSGRSRRLRPVIVTACVIALAAAGVGAYLAFGRPAQAETSGATIQTAADGQTREALVSELDRQVADGMMVVTLNPRLVVGSAGENLLVGFANDSSNHAAQRFEIVQDGRTVYTSEIIGVGETMETIPMPKELTCGQAVVRVQSLNGDGTDQGSPSEVKVTVVNASADKEVGNEKSA